ncbi:hydroxymethylglutaryl-CoA lyase [Agrococcus sp. BE272]|uniref:hydroxymethylglutaryl-CoA lyase n=1 Tax=Agrococcus sp. BE272 TaxID=2817727 RepID=UPI0028669D01|nr:hydroxymethylglutaryl-CoA lyase [Agrococcus sp. BE272]MDR7233879.1 hydroxymethylglutaryl-CoA lyase [Agrococcus sp. BE272]
MTGALELGLPMRRPRAGLPERVTVWEVGPRDGLQAEPTALEPAVRAELIRRLAAAGASVIEAGSFVRADRVPQMARSAEVLAALGDLDARLPVLTPNPRGLQDAIDAGAREVAVFLSATETFSRANLGASMADAEAAAEEVVRTAVDRGMRVRGYVSMVFGDPWEGAVEPDASARLSERMLAWGVAEVSLGDTIGVATPGAVADVIAAHAARGVPVDRLALHMHDTYGQALANVYAGLEAGVRIFDSAVAGTGGCPFARSATGNLATEDLLWMLDGLGIEHGMDLSAIAGTGDWLSAELGRATTSRVARALAGGKEAR